MTNKQNGLTKDCAVCGQPFTDTTKPKNRKNCSKECARLAKNKHQRIKYRKENPYKPTQREEFYHDHYEYPYWATDEKTAVNNMWNEGMPTDGDKLEYMAHYKQYEEIIGGRKRRTEKIDYNGDEKGSHGVSVQFVETDRKPSEVTSYKMTPEELVAYLADKRKK